jgi:hypothetical protein
MARCPSIQDPLTWVEVSLSCPCTICGAVSECSTLEGDAFALCRHTISDWPMLGGGWLHRGMPRLPRELEPMHEREAVVS